MDRTVRFRIGFGPVARSRARAAELALAGRLFWVCAVSLIPFGFFAGGLIDGFIDAEEFKRQIDEYIRVFRATKPAPGTNGPLIPGDPEREAEQERRKNGVPLILPVIEELREISKKAGIPFD